MCCYRLVKELLRLKPRDARSLPRAQPHTKQSCSRPPRGSPAGENLSVVLPHKHAAVCCTVKRHLGLLVPGKCFLQSLPLMSHGRTLPTGTLLCPQPYIYILFSTHMNFKHEPCHATVSRPPQQPTILLEAQFLRVARKCLSNIPTSAIKSAGHIRPLGILWVLGDTALAIPVLGKASSK